MSLATNKWLRATYPTTRSLISFVLKLQEFVLKNCDFRAFAGCFGDAPLNHTPFDRLPCADLHYFNLVQQFLIIQLKRSKITCLLDILASFIGIYQMAEFTSSNTQNLASSPSNAVPLHLKAKRYQGTMLSYILWVNRLNQIIRTYEE